MAKKQPPKSKKQLLRERRQQQERTRRALSVAGIVIVVLAVVFVLIWQNLPKDPGEIVIPDPNPRPQAKNNAMGDPNAPVLITEYSDFQCPACKSFSDETESLLVDAYVKTGKVYFIYRSMGEWIGPESTAAANAAYCAGDQGKFWEYHDILFANWSGENEGSFNTTRLLAFGEAIGLEKDQFNSCVRGVDYKSFTIEDNREGLSLGVNATPYFFITYTVNDEERTIPIRGAASFGEFQTAIENALAEIGQ